MPELSARFHVNGFRFAPGPLAAPEPLYSIELKDIEEYDPSEIAAAILQFPGILEVYPSASGWRDWQALWEYRDRIIVLDMIPDETWLVGKAGTEIWSGCGIGADCLVSDLIELWEGIRRRCPGVWLDDGGAYGEISSRWFSPTTFLETPLPTLLDK